MPLYKDASGQLVIAASLPPGGSAVAGPASSALGDVSPWLRALDSGGSADWHPANYYNDGGEAAGTISGYLTRQSVVLPADATGAVADFTEAAGQFVVLLNGVDITADCVFGSSDAVDIAADIDPATGAYAASALTADIGSIAFTAEYKGQAITLVFTVAKATAGADALNSAIVYIYRRSASVPILPSAATTYTFASGELAGLDNGWSTTIPSGADPLYVSSSTAISADDTDTIAAGEWASPVVLAQDGVAGLNTATIYLFQRTASAAPPALPSATVTYTFATGVAAGVNNGWAQSLPTSGGSYRWVTTATALSTDATDTIAAGEWAAASLLAQDGATGAAGLNTAIVYIYKRSASTPALPSVTTTYDFAAKSLSGLNNGWTTTVPAGTDPLYVSTATASSSASTDTIAAGEWASPVILAQNGATGSAGANGADGLNTATIYLFQRTASATPPALPSATVTYTFATGVAAGVNNGWTQSMPTSGGSYRWVTTATALSTGSTDTIAAGEWAAVSLLAQDGADGSSGANARAVMLSVTDQAFAYDTAGANPSPSSATVTATAYNTSGTVYYQFLKNGVSVQNTTTATYAYTPQAAFGSMPDKIEVKIREGASTGTVLATDTLSMLAIQAGADAITVVLSNAAHTVPTDSAGNNGVYTGSGTTVRVFEGATELNYDGAGTTAGNWNVTASGSSITPGSKSDSGAYATYAAHSAMTADTAAVTYTISGKRANGTAFSQTVTQTLSKSKQGATGAGGSDGVSARAVELTTTAQAFAYNTAGASPSPASATVTATAYNTAGTVYYEFLKNGTTVQNTTTNTYSYTPQAAFGSMPDKLEVKIREGASTGTVLATDTLSMLAIQAGADAITVVLSNAAHTIPTDSAGNNGNYTGSGTTVRVFEGSTELEYDGVGTAAGKWNVTASGSNITPGSKTDSGLYATYGNHSAMTADTASIGYVISGKRANGAAFSQTVTQTLSKSKQGATGATGSTGSTGTAGDSARRCYSKTTLTSLATTPATITTSGDSSFPANNSWGTGTVWQATPPVIVAGEQLYQSDGVYSPATGNTVWNVPYLSSLKVGQLSAITTETGTLTVGSGGHIKSGQTAFDTGAGFWIEGGATPKMSLGDASKGFYWNGTTFGVRGDIIATGNINVGAVTALEGTYYAPPVTLNMPADTPFATADTLINNVSLALASVDAATARIIQLGGVIVHQNTVYGDLIYLAMGVYEGATLISSVISAVSSPIPKNGLDSVTPVLLHQRLVVPANKAYTIKLTVRLHNGNDTSRYWGASSYANISSSYITSITGKR
jgi:hypothetical protein